MSLTYAPISTLTHLHNTFDIISSTVMPNNMRLFA